MIVVPGIELGAVAVIEGKDGGLRVVVSSDDRSFASQLARGDWLFIVPGFYEPMYPRAGEPHHVAADRVAAIIERAVKAYRERPTNQ